MVEAGDGASSGSGSSGCAAPPWLGASASGYWGRRRGGGAGRDKDGRPFGNRQTQGSNRSASGPASGVDGVANLRDATRRSEQRSFPLVEAQSQAPPPGEARPLAEPALSLRQPIDASPRADPVPAPDRSFSGSSAHGGRFLKPRLRRSSGETDEETTIPRPYCNYYGAV
ncbi:uncharacterized protein [Symphalangus syndactylus]|uniref:uncharacterized protein isoform X1 n=1 Tax=Symphalangus syndactylus TaxID=9590 RepID=UPI003007D881